MESLVDVAVSIHGNEQLALALGGDRWAPSKLGALCGSPQAVFESLAKVVQEKRPELGFSMGDLEALVVASDRLAALERTALGDRFRASLAADPTVVRQASQADNVRATVMAHRRQTAFQSQAKL